ncbi:bifunctional ADP-dependent (S)-NAD(P)H-hydrate dehydratase/NAD(P)H-hydrate epimerase [Paenibacillus yonginensis]|uniref:Bifunctional NAD(P)H-hydrate repair enzyme n=1 Tax=Paenibacillus yonginensis TaxID=1462996 RepID=A0A1B1N5S9_9BACL|nr:bifunctional ADP-dependent NAD(P)H-hydrate dehydratase/NAD(P)H-hydrate epimerase [Paenibacillus yonginensis]ANS76776.1 bifunctional ADP-dependent (S)-NAD(P)H-hydrate dehydratase/NAD(P)H-hydrate epimerase [Paenibacillus yonginensis]
MRIVSREQMRALDKAAIEGLGIPALVLMENAGRAIAEEVIAFCRKRGSSAAAGNDEPAGGWTAAGGYGSPVIRAQRRLGGGDAAVRPERWLILAGKGNNGGDGIVCARHLRAAGIEADLLYADEPQRLSGEAAVQHGIAERLNLPFEVYEPGRTDFTSYTGIVDALLGTGSSGAPRGRYAALIGEAAGSGLPVVAADIPSGIDSDSGEVPGACIRADVTVALGYLKAGLTQYPAAGYAGEVVVRDIGIPDELAEQAGGDAFLLTESVLRSRLGADPAGARHRQPDAHKGSYGHVLLAGGSMAMTGACLLAGRAALRGGCGLATWALPEGTLPYVLGAVPELMLAPVGQGGDRHWSAPAAADVLRLLQTRDVLAAGPGLGRFAGDTDWLRALWEGADKPLVLDADALNILAAADGLHAWPRRDAPTILTPHPGEMARLAGMPTAEVQRDRLGLARRFAAEHGVTLVLKGARTVVAAADGRVFVNATGNPGMATGGTGDVLTGLIASLLAQGHDDVAAACLGVYLHGAAGDKAAAARGSAASLLAGDLIDAL